MLNRKKFSDIKSLINLSLVRLNTLRKKTADELKHKKRILAKNLQDGEYGQARLEAERIVKLDWKIEALNLIELKCEEVRDNATLLQNEKTVPYDLDEAIATIIFSSTRCNIPELNDVVKVLTRKYGVEYIELNKDNSAKKVDETLVHRLSGQRPNAFLVYNYMKEIAKNFDVKWEEDEVTKELGERFDIPMSGGGKGMTSASGLGSYAYSVTDGRILPKGQKPKGFVPPDNLDDELEKIKMSKLVTAEEVEDENEELNQEGNNDDNDEGDQGGSPQIEQKFEPTPPAQPKKKAMTKKTPPKPKEVKKEEPPAPKKKDNDFSDLEARFNKLRDL